MPGLQPMHQLQWAVFSLLAAPQQQTSVLAPPCPALDRNSLHNPNVWTSVLTEQEVEKSDNIKFTVKSRLKSTWWRNKTKLCGTSRREVHLLHIAAKKLTNLLWTTKWTEQSCETAILHKYKQMEGQTQRWRAPSVHWQSTLLPPHLLGFQWNSPSTLPWFTTPILKLLDGRIRNFKCCAQF